ncbi:hypothetical protein UPYG_G00238140 [Umbra pygmaea]|uniref:DUF6729 domain-containing protein n=1 Tax=Umbra pygmaea TaxID=75934 RepID=A0ABD0WEU8_UMBPY
MSKPKTHKAMGDEEWMSRLKRFATSGVWPAEAGNRPAPRQKRWYDHFQKIQRCLLQAKGQTSLFGGPQTCLCGFHHQMLTSGPAHASAAALGSATPPGSTTNAAPGLIAATAPAPASASTRPKLNLSMFSKPRFGGSHGDAAKPNLNLVRKAVQPSSPSTHELASQHPSSPAASSRRSPSPFSVPPSSPAAASRRSPSPFSVPPSSPAAASRTSPSPFSVPPSSPAAASRRCPSPFSVPPSSPAAASRRCPSPFSVPPSSPAASSRRCPSPFSVPPSSPAASSRRSPSNFSLPPSSPVSASRRTPSPFSLAPSSPAAVSMRTPSSVSPEVTAGAVSQASNLSAGAIDEHELPPPVPGPAPFWLPVEMTKTIPLQDQRWIASTLFHAGKLRPDVKLWYEPPVPSLIYHQAPTPDRFFTHRLLAWMPYHLWKARLFCPTCGKQLTGYGVHKRAWKVLDIDRYYLMVTETLRCTVCRLNYLSTSQTVLDQLDLPHRRKFRLILTRKYACDIRVIRMLRERTLGNSPTCLVKQLRENHSEEWLDHLADYLGECAAFVDQPSLFPVACQEPPEPVDVPTSRWLLSVYGRDIISRLDHIKASITSTFGSILKMDSTKKITRKLSGTARGTALWLSSVSNEIGQILISVLTAQEGAGLDKMASGLLQRYSQAGVAPPVLLYVDCGCCVEEGQSKLQARFGGWPDLYIRLDIWHFMRRLAAGCTTDAHPLYPTFMGRLSVCIFEWDAADVGLLRHSKREQLRREGVPLTSDVDRHITKKELALYCRRRTRGEEDTTRCIEHLLQELMGDKGRDLLGVPLLDQVRMEHIWRVQQRHVKCIQDVPGVSLYTSVGSTTTKDGVILTKYMCARGSTSPESFHCHLNRFIPGTSANSLNFQLYLLEGLNRWNQDRAAASLSTKPSSLLSYAGDVVQSVNNNSAKVFGRKFVSSFRAPTKYTGELIGVDYLFRQTGQPIQSVDPDQEETDQQLEDLSIEDDEEDDEGFEDYTMDLTLGSLLDDISTTTQPPPSSPQPLDLTLGSSLDDISTVSTTTQPPPTGPLPAPTGPLPAPTGPLPAPTGPLPAPTGPLPAPTGPLPAPTGPLPAPTGPLPAASPPDVLGAPPEEQLAVDEHNMPGMDRVDSLAECLVELRIQTRLTLSNQQVSNIVGLWQNLLDYDKQRVVLASRYQDRLTTGKFRSPKKKAVFTPGVDSLNRCVLGASASPAQWPDCCRLVEAIFVRLCSLHKSQKKKGNGTVTRWTLILQDYKRIRQLILANGAIMQSTTLQLVEVNQTTLIQWHNRRVKRQDLSVLMQGINLPGSIPVASEPLPPANVRPAVAPPQHQGETFAYHLPQSTAGQAKTKTRATSTFVPSAAVVQPTLAAQRQLFPKASTFQFLIPAAPALPRAPSPPVLIAPRPASNAPRRVPVPTLFTVPQAPGYTASQAPYVLLPTACPAPPAPCPTPKTYKRKVEANTCRKCGQHRTALTGHSQYKGKIYCPSTETVSKEQWLEQMRKT